MAEAVLTTWDEIRSIPNFQVVLGELFFRRIFETAPGAEKLWHFGSKVNDPESMYKHPLFKAHATLLFNTIDKAIGLARTGKITNLADELVTLGRKHYHRGVTSDLYPVAGKALIHALRTVIGNDSFTVQMEVGWMQVYAIISSGMQEGAFYEEFEGDDFFESSASQESPNIAY